MNEVELTYHTGSRYVNPRHISKEKAQIYIDEWANDELLEEAGRFNKKHFIYCTKTYDSNDALIKVDLYCNVALDDEEFHKRIKNNDEAEKKAGNYVYYGVWHKGTAY